MNSTSYDVINPEPLNAYKNVKGVDSMFSMPAFNAAYETDAADLVINGRKFRILQPKYLNRFINPRDTLHEFPLWAKLWEASWVLAGQLAEMPVQAGRHFLEIGGGLGVVSIVAAAFGHRITMTEYNSDALQFARANAHINGCPQLPVVKLDWHRPGLQGRFDCIVASEVVYRDEDFSPLLALFKTYLKPAGEIILASEMRRSSGAFFARLQPIFDIQVQKKILRSASRQIPIILFRLKFAATGQADSRPSKIKN